MSVRFRFVNMLLTIVSSRLPTECQKYSTRCGPLRKREPNTASASPEMIGSSNAGQSAGSYSRSASCTITTLPVLAASAVRIAAPFPMLSG